VSGRRETTRHLETVDVWQLDVQQNDRWAEASRLRHRARAIARLADDLVALRGEELARRTAERLVIIDDENAPAHPPIVAQLVPTDTRVCPGQAVPEIGHPGSRGVSESGDMLGAVGC
jgi:hypothetical protein